MQINTDGISAAVSAYQKQFPKITFHLNPSEARKAWAEKKQSVTTGAQNTFISGEEFARAIKENEEITYRLSRTVMHDVTEFFEVKGSILNDIKSAKSSYDYSDVINATGFAYAKLYAEIQKRHENPNEKWYKSADGEELTLEDELEWLDNEFEQQIAWEKSCAKSAAETQKYCRAEIPEVPYKEIEGIEDDIYEARNRYLNLYHRDSIKLVLQNFRFDSVRSFCWPVIKERA